MDYFEKKQWIRIGVCIVIVAVIVLAMTGVFGGKGDLVYPLPTQDAAVKGFGGEVTAHVRLNDDKTIQTLSIDTPDETEGLGKRASEAEFTDQFIGKAAPFTLGEDGIEALSGATVTSKAAVRAINWAATGEEPAPEVTAEPETKASAAAGAEATEQGFGGEVTVHAELNEDGTVKSLSIDTPDETEGLGKRASEAEFTDQFIGKSGPFAYGENGIEALSGATVTSNAALAAINRATAGGNAGAEGEPAAAGSAKEATEQGFGGDVTVHAELNDDGTVKSLSIDTPNETEGLGKRASEAEFTDQFIGKSAPFAYGENGIEALSGATVTSNAVLAALNRAAAGGEEAPAETEKAEEPTEQPAEPTETKTEAAAGQAYGVYRSVKQNDFSTVTVTAAAKNGVLTDVKITSEGEEGKDLLTDEIRKEWAKAILESGSAAPEAITGATLKFSAGSVQEAMEEILAKMNAEPAAEEAGTEEPAAEEPAAEEPAAEETTEKPAEESAETKTEASNGQAYGVYRSVKQNDFSTITVTAAAKNGVLTDVKITSEGEEGKDLLTDEIRKEWAKAILESGSASPDAITGATLKFSAGSVQEAMEEILAKVNGEAAEPAAEEPAAEEATEQPAEEPAETKTEAAAGQAYGVYRSVKQNDFSTVTVTAAAKNGVLTDVKITSEGEEGKDLLTDETKAAWAKAILESGSAAPDAITGATLKFSAGSVQEAMEEILAKVNGETAEPAEEEPAAEEPAADEPTTEEPAAEVPAAEESVVTEPAPYAGYRADSENQFSRITVIACTEKGKLVSVKILSEGEEGKDLLTDETKAAWAKAILESGSAAPDAITGATLTFSAGSVQEAMTQILAKLPGQAEEPAAEEPATEEPAAEEPAAEEPAAEEAIVTEPAPYAGYRADSENQFSRITVIAYTEKGKLVSVKILSEGEEGKDLLTDETKAAWAKAILESGSASPDAVTGATLAFSAGSVQEAMTQILAKLPGRADEPAADEPAAEEPAPEEPAAETGEQAEGGENILSLIAVSMGREAENSYVTDYLEQDPYLVNIYEGYGFAKDYGSARGHYYTLTDVDKTQRPHAKANCLTCKTPDMHKMIEEQGVSVYSMPFDEVMAQMTQPIGCYSCHGADDGNGGQMVVTHQYVNEALGENTSEIKAASLSCGQCHIEYYFTPSDSEAMMPYHSKAEMTPEAILAYYDAFDFYDWEQPGTGTKMLKAQHPELETWSYGKHSAILSCADCHMPLETTESGTQYHDHHLVSPLQSETLLAKCAACHGSAENTISLVQGIQEKVTARETEVGNKLSALKDALTAAAAAGSMGEEELDAVRKLHREAQWYFDFCYVENSEGAHNSELAYRCLDTSEAKIDEAMGLLNAAGATSEEAPAEGPAA